MYNEFQTEQSYILGMKQTHYYVDVTFHKKGK